MDELALHDQRLSLVTGILLNAGVRRVVDLGCGAGRLLADLLVHPQFTELTGLDSSAEALAVTRRELMAMAGSRLNVLHGSVVAPHPALPACDAITLIEVIEHLDPSRLSMLERTVFACYRPPLVLLTTPNAEYNPLLGLTPGQWRDPDHRFEWSRERFRAWAAGVARRHAYSLRIGDIGESHPQVGSPSQYAQFTRALL